MRLFLPPIAAFAVSFFVADSPWKIEHSGVSARFRGVSVVNARIAWASGSQGTCVKTVDGGSTWKRLSVPESSQLDLRDIQAIDDQIAYLLSIGPGETLPDLQDNGWWKFLGLAIHQS